MTLYAARGCPTTSPHPLPVDPVTLYAARSCQTTYPHPLNPHLSPAAPQNIHIIGISVGAFAADAAVNRLRKYLDQRSPSSSSPPVRLQLTLLDPFTQRGVLGVNWGTRNFGKNADYAQQFLNTDDPVPSTNEPCDSCAVWDVTRTERRKGEEGDVFGHDWPLVHYTKYESNVGMVEEGDRKGRGTVTQVT